MAGSIWLISRLAQRREAQHELELRFVGRREPELRLEVVGELAPHPLAREERVERGERDLARVVEREHLAVGGDRVFGLAELLLVDLGHLRVERLALRRLRRRARCAGGRRR